MTPTIGVQNGLDGKMVKWLGIVIVLHKRKENNIKTPLWEGINVMDNKASSNAL